MLVACVLDRLYPLPLPSKNNASVLVTARDGRPLRAFASENGVWRYPVKVEEVSPLYLEALIGYEDRYYYYHAGVNPFAMVRAAMQGARRKSVV